MPCSRRHLTQAPAQSVPARQREDSSNGSFYDAPQPALAAALSPADRAKLALEFAEVYRHDGDDQQAVAYFKLALHLNPSDAANINAKIAAIEAAQRLEAANAARRPVIHKALDQPLIVRSRLTVAPRRSSTHPEGGGVIPCAP